MAKAHPLLAGFQRSPTEQLALDLELLLDGVKIFPPAYCFSWLVTFYERVEEANNIKKEILAHRDEYAALARGPVKLGQKWYTSAHEAITAQVDELYSVFLEHNNVFVLYRSDWKWAEQKLDDIRADICKFLEPLLEDIRLAAAQLAGERALLAKRRNSGLANLEWSKPVAYKALRTALHISHNALKARLVDSAEPVVGMIRYKGPKNAKKIQIVVPDLPVALQGMFRRTRSQASN
jgi:hypothetical protein